MGVSGGEACWSDLWDERERPLAGRSAFASPPAPVTPLILGALRASGTGEEGETIGAGGSSIVSGWGGSPCPAVVGDAVRGQSQVPAGGHEKSRHLAAIFNSRRAWHLPFSGGTLGA